MMTLERSQFRLHAVSTGSLAYRKLRRVIVAERLPALQHAHVGPVRCVVAPAGRRHSSYTRR